MTWTPEAAERIRALFDEAVELDPSAAVALLASEDDAIRAEVVRLVSAEREAASLFSSPRATTFAHSPTAHAVPPPTFVGPYRLLERLGEGGMGCVFRARRGSEPAVAIKLVRHQDAATLQGLRREVLALSRLDHPGIVRILDHGVVDGSPWYAMAIVDGTPLRGALDRELAGAGAMAPLADADRSPAADLPGAPAAEGAHSPAVLVGAERVRRVVTVSHRLCSALAYMHGEGLVHRDLKPDNVIVTGDGEPVIVDFGLAVASRSPEGREALVLSGEVVGTAAYISPEQARGEIVDARSDLYALGCLMYELLLRRPPFSARTAGELLMMHLTRDPVPPSSLAHGIPPALERLVLRLLSKDPRDRYGYAEDVAAELSRHGAQAPRPSPRPRPYLYRPALAGRGVLLASIRDELLAVARGEPRLLLLSGPSGMGKTRVASEAGAHARERGFLVLAGACSSARGPLEALREPLQEIADICTERGGARTDMVFGPGRRRAAVLAPYHPAIAGLVGSTSGPTTELPHEAARAQVLAALRDVLFSVGDAAPVLLVLDDLQWADELTIELLRSIPRAGVAAGRGPRVGVVGTCRTDEATPALGGLLAAEGDDAVRVLRLERLADADVASMLEGMLGLEHAPGAFASYLARQSEGNPFFVAEYLRTALAEGLLDRDTGGQWRVGADRSDTARESAYEALPLPGNVRDLVARRLHRLDALERRVVDAACVLGRRVDPGLLAAVLEDAEAVDLSAPRLIGRQLFAEAAAGALEFAHDKIREVAYEALDPAARRGHHRRAASALLALAPGASAGEGDRAAQLGRHFEGAEEIDRALPFYLEAARIAVSKLANDEAERLYRRYLALAERPTAEAVRIPEPGVQALEARRELADVLCLRGRLEEASRELRRAADEAMRGGHREEEGLALTSLGSVLQIAGRSEEALEPAEQGLAIARDLGDPARQAVAMGTCATVLKRCGRPGEAWDLFVRALATARQSGDRAAIATALVRLAVGHRELGNPDAASEALAEALVLRRELGDRSGEAGVLAVIADGEIFHGRTESALDAYAKALSIHRAAGNRLYEGRVLTNLAVGQYHLGQISEARASCEAAVEIHREVGEPQFLGTALQLLGALAILEGRVPDAIERFGEALVVARRSGERREVGSILDSLGYSQGERGNWGEARRLHAEALAVRRGEGDRLREGITLVCFARVARAEGKTDEARAFAAEARAIAQEIRYEELQENVLAAEAGILLDDGDVLAARGLLEQACGKAAARKARMDQGRWLKLLARCALIESGPDGATGEIAAEAERWLAETGAIVIHAETMCVRGHLELARGSSASEELAGVRTVVERLGYAEGSELGRDLARLERARSAREAGRPLIAGVAEEDVTPGQLRWLLRHRPAALPPAVRERLEAELAAGRDG